MLRLLDVPVVLSQAGEGVAANTNARWAPFASNDRHLLPSRLLLLTLALRVHLRTRDGLVLLSLRLCECSHACLPCDHLLWVANVRLVRLHLVPNAVIADDGKPSDVFERRD